MIATLHTPTRLYHPDGVSGTTILHDGTKLFWSEGRSSRVVADVAGGGVEVFDASSDHPLLHLMMQLDECGYEVDRAMTPAEQREWECWYYNA